MWDDYTGLGVVIGVIDSGIEYSHPDLLGQIDTTLDHDAIDGDDDGSAETSSEKHGTTVAGTIAAAANNGIGVAGVAYGAKVAGFRQGFGEGVEAQLAENLGLQWTVATAGATTGSLATISRPQTSKQQAQPSRTPFRPDVGVWARCSSSPRTTAGAMAKTSTTIASRTRDIR